MIKRLILLVLAFMCCGTIFTGANTGKIVATDTFGRKVKTVSGYKKDKYVGLFYFTWHGFSGTNKVFDVTKIMRDNQKLYGTRIIIILYHQ